MSSTGQKGAKVVTRAILENLIAAGKTDNEIALELGVSRMTVNRHRNKYGLQSNTKKIDEQKMVELHSMGATDEVIANELGCTRQNITAARKRLGLAANRKSGQRGTGKVKNDAPYALACAAALRNPIVNKATRVAIKDHLNQGGSEHAAWAATLIAPTPMICVDPYVAGQIDNMTPSTCSKISDYEKRADKAGMAGVPGAALLELHRLIESDQETIGLIKHLAAKAVKQAGYINADATLEQVEEVNMAVTDPEKWHNHWQGLKKQATAWAPKNDPPPREAAPKSWYRPAYEPHTCFNNLTSSGGSGKKGKGGGRQNQADAIAFTAMSRV